MPGHDISAYGETVVGGLKYRLAKTEEDRKRVVDFLFDVFFQDEPVSKTKGGLEGRPESVEGAMAQLVAEGVSLMVTDPSKDDLLVGIRVSGTKKREEVSDERPTPEVLMEQGLPEIVAMILSSIDHIYSIWDAFQKYPDMKKMYYMVALATLPEYRGRGIATELIRQCFKVAKLANCDGALVSATNDHTRKIFHKVGMEETARMRWNDFPNEIFRGYLDDVTKLSECLSAHTIKF